MENTERRICLASGKTIYSKADAGRVVNGIKGHNTASHIYRGSNKPSRYYFCKECGGYHTTHLKQETKKGYYKKPLKTIYGKGYMGEDGEKRRKNRKDYKDLVW